MRDCMSLKSERGMSLTVVLFAVTLSGIVAIGMLAWDKEKLRAKRQANIQSTAEQIKQKLVGAVISPESWKITQSKNSSAFAALLAATGTSQGQSPSPQFVYPSIDIHLAGKSPSLYYSPSPNAGFNLKGEPCSSYNQKTGNDECPFHYDIQLVKHVQQNGNWIDTLQFKLDFRPATLDVVLNTTQGLYSFPIDRNFNPKSVETSCIAIGGTYNPALGECSAKVTPVVDCSGATHQAYIGPKLVTGTSHCETAQVSPKACGSHEAISGFTSGGSPQCASL
jgi:hypothetical protein